MATPMEGGQHHPVSGISIALATSLTLTLFGLDWLLVLIILFVWIGSLYLASERPPAAPVKSAGISLSREYMSELIEHAATPLLVVEDGRIATANREARHILGKHIVGQDARMAFRQPRAIKLLAKNRSGAAVVRGLVRRRDIWRINLQKIDKNLSVLELTNRTAEADMSRAHTDFVANASHELRTPLASIIGYVETLQEDPGSLDGETAGKFLGTILNVFL